MQKKFDVIVSGGGLSGVAAAVAAARQDAKVLLIERYGFLGGMATAGLVNPFMPYTVNKEHDDKDSERKVNRGIFEIILNDLEELGGLHINKSTFNEELLKLVLDRMLKRFNISVLFHSCISGVSRAERKLKSVFVTNKSGHQEYQACYFVDATGDADVCHFAECEYNIGRAEDHACQPMTLCFRLADVDKSRCDYRVINQKYTKMKQNGSIKNPRENVLIFNHMVNDILHFNSTRIIRKSGINAQELTEAEMEAREQVYELYTFLKKNIAGYENCQLLMSAPQIGVRETRRISGEYTLTQEDLLQAVKFEDSVARGTYPVDIHNPDGEGTVIKRIPYGDYYTIPYRTLIPQGIDNLIAAGRPISSTHEAHSAIRVMPICTCIGEGAGTAASIALRESVSFRQVDVGKIHNLLDQHGALY